MNFTKFLLLTPQFFLQNSAFFFGMSCVEFVLTNFLAILCDNHLSLFIK